MSLSAELGTPGLRWQAQAQLRAHLHAHSQARLHARSALLQPLEGPALNTRMTHTAWRISAW